MRPPLRMPTSRSRPRPRRHSLSSGDESFYPHPAKSDGLPRPDSRRRARLPRSKSTSNVFDALGRTHGTADYDTSNVALEQVDIVALRELATVLRTTGPPSDRPVTHDDCFRLSGSGDPKRWSLQSLRRTKRTKFQRNSLQAQLPENVVPGTTAEGHRYNAISTRVPKKNNGDDGPWFRSQYPVFLPSSQPPSSRPSSSPVAWPERSSSKAASFSNAEGEISLGEHRNSARPNSRHVGNDHSRSRALSNRVSTDQLLRAMLNPVDEGSEDDIGSSLKMLGSQRSHGVGHTQTQPLPLVAVDDEDIDRLESSRQAAPSGMNLAIKPQPGNTRQQSSSALENRKSPGSPERSSQRLANISVQPSLAVPKENRVPESPGFPNMLANMNFPSPPKGSRPSSPASPTSSITDSLLSRPMVQPRTSSRRAATSTSVSGVSLNEIVMQNRPSSKRTKSDRLLHAETTVNLDTNIAEAPPRSRASTAHADPLASSSDTALGKADQKSTSHSGSTEPFYEEPTAPSRGGGEEGQRGSLASQLTATTESSRQSTSTRNSYRSSSASELSTQSKSTIIAQKTYIETTQPSDRIDSSISERCASAESQTIAAGQSGIGLTKTNTSDLNEEHEETTRGFRLLAASNLKTEPKPKPQSIIERRLARKAKVREYKMRDLDASRADVVDSPILGYFPPNLPQGRDSPVEGYSPRRPSTLSMATTISEASNETLQSFDVKAPAELHHELSSQRQSQSEVVQEVPRMPSVQLKISAVNTTDIEPIYPPTPHWHTSGIAMSPIMVVADVESRPGSPTLRFSTLARPESASPSPRVRLKPLKISPHSRQKSLSVTISRNPTTGAIERSSSAPIDHKYNRRSLMTMPTPPMSPEVSQVSKRLSLPPVQLNLPVTPRERTPPSRCQEWHSLETDEREPGSGSRSTTVRERVMREKLQKEKEITDIVARTVGLPHKQTVHITELESLPLEQNNTESLEKRLQRLERTNDAWLSAMKPLMEAMTRTLDDMRVDDRSSSLRMSDFVIDMEAEARRVTHSRRGEIENTSTTWHSVNRIERRETRTRNAAVTLGSTPLSPVLQEPDKSPISDVGEAAGPLAVVDQPGTTEESRGWTDLDPLIRDLSMLPRKSREEHEGGGSHSPSALNPLMRELMNASQLSAAEVTELQ
ncbi:hypothetical protein F5Y03DRAFT_94913 [Xylaria venustula]|nr:hypothetical protein F5Y03DRAFT_94913 [Xylaria venustula]